VEQCLRPVVSGVAPETLGSGRIIVSILLEAERCHPTKFGVTPNFTGETPVPPPKSKCIFSVSQLTFAAMKQLENQIAVVTGAGRGIGRAIALKFAAHGADIVAVDLKTEFVQETVDEVRKLGRKAWAVAANVADAASVEAAVAQILQEPGRVDILVNNAGITKDGLLMRMSEADWDAVLDINLKGAFLFTKELSRPLLKQRSGRVVNIASVIGLIGNAGQCNYSASKAGVIGLTKSCAREFASRGITVNAIAPGFIQTAMTDKLSQEQKDAITKQIPLASLGQPEDVAEAALFFASPAARYITGQVLPVDGGMVM
jgi:3-oxoacyl-[acyl-carrier protein] reductase